MNANQPLTNSLGIDWAVGDPRIATEEEEPLLLLADYVAGVVHSRNSKADTLSRSAISKQAASAVFERLTQCERFLEFQNQVPLRYFDIFPEFRRYAKGVT